MAASNAETEKLRKSEKEKIRQLKSKRKCLADSDKEVKILKKENLRLRKMANKSLKDAEHMDNKHRIILLKLKGLKKDVSTVRTQVETTEKLLSDSQNENQGLRVQISQLKAKLAESQVAQNAMLRLAQAMNISQTQENSTPPARKRIKIENTSI